MGSKSRKLVNSPSDIKRLGMEIPNSEAVRKIVDENRFVEMEKAGVIDFM